MTHEVDDDLEISMKPDATPNSGGKGASKRGSSYMSVPWPGDADPTSDDAACSSSQMLMQEAIQ